MDPFDLVGDVLDGQYRVEEFVGEGALSVVYRAINESVSAPVCVKCLNLPSTLDAAFVSSVVTSFHEGCKLHYRLARGHLAIAQTFTSGMTVAPRTGVQIPYLVREWFEGESLSQELRRRRAEGEHGRALSETIELFTPIAAALAYAHTQDAAHLSLMPSNLFLAKNKEGGEPSLKLLDFGVGRVVDEVVSSRSGSAAAQQVRLLLPTYAAPEQLLGTLGATGPWTDVYALALVLLEVLSDRVVMSEKDATALVARALGRTARPSPRSHGVTLPPAVDRVLTRALSLEPESRHETVAEFWDELVIAARPKRTKRRLVSFLRRRRRMTRPRQSTRPPAAPVFPEEEPSTTKAQRPSVRPPPLIKSVRPKAPPPPARRAPAVVPLPVTRSRTPTLALNLPLTPPVAPPAPEPPKPKPSTAPPLPSLFEPLALHTEIPDPPLPDDAPKPPQPPPLPPKIIVAPPPTPIIEPAVFAPPTVPVESNGRLEPHEIPVLASPLSLPRRHVDRRIILGACVGATLFIALVVIVIAAVRHKSHATPIASATSSAQSVAAVTAPPPTATADPPIATTTATATASAIPSATIATTATRAGPFNKKRALAAIAASTSDLGDCKRKGGVWGSGQAGVIFANDGSVRRVIMGPPFRGVDGDCVTAHITQTHIDPFTGVIGPIYARFVIPYQP